MIFSVQNSNFMYSVGSSPDLVQIQVRETVSEIFLARMDIPIHGIWWKWCEGVSTNIIWHEYPWQRNNLEKCKWWREWLRTYEGITPTRLALDMWLNQSTISSFLGSKQDQPKTPLQKIKMRASRKQWHLPLHNNHYNLVQLCVLKNFFAARQLFH